MDGSRHFLLYRDGRWVRATDVSQMVAGGYPATLAIEGREYRHLANEDTFIFWNDLRDSSGSTVGYTFLEPRDPTLLASSLVNESENVMIDCVANLRIVTILLRDCNDPREECVQGFGSEVYQSISDPLDCLLLMYHFSNEDPIGFELDTGVVVTRLT